MPSPLPSSAHLPIAPSLNPPSPPGPLPPSPHPPTLSSNDQQSLLALLAKGASPAAACQHLRLPVTTYNHTIDTDDTFRRQLDHIQTLLSQNVAASLYRTAMEGNVTAMTFWLKASPPPGWSDSQLQVLQPATFDETLNQLSDADLAQLARAMGVDLPRESETGVA
jgi:hypothetical protein